MLTGCGPATGLIASVERCCNSIFLFIMTHESFGALAIKLIVSIQLVQYSDLNHNSKFNREKIEVTTGNYGMVRKVARLWVHRGNAVIYLI